MLAMSESGIIENKSPGSHQIPVKPTKMSTVVLPQRIIQASAKVVPQRIQLRGKRNEESGVSPAFIRLKRPGSGLPGDLEGNPKKLKPTTNNNPPTPAEFGLTEPVLSQIFRGTFDTSVAFNVQVMSLSSPRRDSLRRARLSDGYNETVNCLMNSKINVEFLNNPIIRVVKWSLIRHQNTECLHVTDFITVKNSLNFPLLGNPTNLLRMPILPKTTSEENVEKDGVLIPGRVVNNIIDRIMKNISNHHINVSENTEKTSEEPKSSLSLLSINGKYYTWKKV